MGQSNRKLCMVFYHKNHIFFFVAITATLLNTLLGLAITWILQEMLDAAVGIPGSMGIPGLLLGALGVIFSLFLIKIILYFSKPRFLKKAMIQFKADFFEKLMRKSPLTFKSEKEADYLSAFSNDSAAIEEDYLSNQFLLVRNAIEMTGSLTMMLLYNPFMTAIALLFLLIPTAAALLQGNKMEEIEKQVSSQNAASLSLFRDCLSGFSVIKGFNAEKRMAAIMGTHVEAAETQKCKKRKLSTALTSIGSLAALIAQLGTFLTGTILILSGNTMTPGVLVAFMDLTATFIDPVSELPDLMGKRKAALALIQKIEAALSCNYQNSAEEAPTQLTAGINLKNVSYGYGTESEVLKSISFQFSPQKSYAIVGSSGCGKSTLLNLLTGHQQFSGEILYDDIHVNRISSESLFRLVSPIQQNVFIFNASILDNITMFQEFPHEEIEQAIDLSGLTTLMKEKGSHYLCGENGCNLSGGEKQRISIARTLLRNAKILLADEITSSLDPATSCQVIRSILNLKDRLRIVVTHNLDPALLKEYDCILYLKSGRIQEHGTFSQLMEQKSGFYSFYMVSQT